MFGSEKHRWFFPSAAVVALFVLCAHVTTIGAEVTAPRAPHSAGQSRALALYNEGVALHAGDLRLAAARYRAALSLLADRSVSRGLFTPDELTIACLFNLGIALAPSEPDRSREILLELSDFLALLGSRSRTSAMLATPASQLRRTAKPADIANIAARLRPFGASKDTASKRDGFTGFHSTEVALLKSYLDAFQIARHSRTVRSRTYPGRQEDSVLLLRDLLIPNGPRESRQLAALRSLYVPDPKVHAHGAGMTFIDIGPAISNQWTPAITALALCSAFPRMNVVGLDLPDEVTTFLNRVSDFVQAEVRSHPNFHVLSGDGTKSLRAQLADVRLLPLADRPPPPLTPDMPIVVRTSNAIDIYFPWEIIAPTLQNMAADFSEHPLLVLFNRSILFKPKGSRQFRVIGRLSRRGFFHNALRLDSEGEPPYVLGGFFRSALVNARDE